MLCLAVGFAALLAFFMMAAQNDAHFKQVIQSKEPRIPLLQFQLLLGCGCDELEEPFAHPLALARQTEKWPDVVAVCGAGTALVDPTAFEETPRRRGAAGAGPAGFCSTKKYNGKCQNFCTAAGKAINEPLMFAVLGPQYGEVHGCRGDKDDSYKGAVCECSIPDRAGHPQMVQFLLDLSADATSFAGDGKTPLEVAKTHEIRSLLMRSSFLQPALTIFQHYDASGTGCIDGMELGWVMKSIKPHMTDAELQELFASCDANHNGEIDFIEFVMWLFAGGGKAYAQDILASAKHLASGSSGVGQQALLLKAVLSTRAGLDAHVYTYPDFASMPKMAHHPPRDEKLQTCAEYVQQLLSWIPGLPMVEETLQEVQRIADIRNDSSHGAEIQNPELLDCVIRMMVCAIVMWTFDPVLITGDQVYTKEQTFQHMINKIVDKRDAEFFYAARGFFYYFMTALDKLPPATGVVYQGIPRKDITAAREALVEGTTVTWRSFTTALQLWGSMVVYERGLILQITLLPPELRSKGLRFESKGRDISKLSAFSGSSEVLLMPNIRMRVGPEVQKKGMTVIELTELEEDTATTLNAEDFD
eukprot:s1287_g6.t3